MNTNSFENAQNQTKIYGGQSVKTTKNNELQKLRTNYMKNPFFNNTSVFKFDSQTMAKPELVTSPDHFEESPRSPFQQEK